MEIMVLLNNPSKKTWAITTVKAYETEVEGVAVHRDFASDYDWRVTDILTGSTFGFTAQTKKKAMEYFHENGYVEKLAEFRKGPKYTKWLKIFEEAKASYLKREAELEKIEADEEEETEE